MEYLYYKSKRGNFGDDLNPWLWERLFKDSLEISDEYLIGIGSVLNVGNKVISGLDPNKRKIVFGTGIRPSKDYIPFCIDKSWDIRFLRGPLSSNSLGNIYPYITDAAYALRQLDNFDIYLKTEKKYKVSLMPYYMSLEYFDWEKICAQLGYNYISPLSEQGVEHTLREIASSETLITEAMHGAIVADILRVPWNRFILSTPHTEGSNIADFKWADWLYSVKVYSPPVTFIRFYRKTFLNGLCRTLTNQAVSPEFFVRSRVKKDLIERIKSVDKFVLSSDEALKEIDEKIALEVEKLKAEFKKQ